LSARRNFPGPPKKFSLAAQEISLTRPRNFPWPPKKFPWAVYQVFLGVVVGGVGGIKKIWRNLRYATRMLNCDNKEFA